MKRMMHEEMPVKNNASRYGKSRSRRRIDELLEVVNLTDARKRPLGGYSGGMHH